MYIYKGSYCDIPPEAIYRYKCMQIGKITCSMTTILLFFILTPPPHSYGTVTVILVLRLTRPLGTFKRQHSKWPETNEPQLFKLSAGLSQSLLHSKCYYTHRILRDTNRGKVCRRAAAAAGRSEARETAINGDKVVPPLGMPSGDG